MWLLHASENFPVFYHSTSFILSACGCCMGKFHYRNTKYKYVICRLGPDVWFSSRFLCVCFVLYGTLSKNDHAGPTCGRTRLSQRNRYFFIWGFVEAHVTCWTMNVATGGRGGVSLDLGCTQIYSGNRAALVDILRKQGNGSTFGRSDCGNLENTFRTIRPLWSVHTEITCASPWAWTI